MINEERWDEFAPKYVSSVISDPLYGIQNEIPACITLEGE